MAQGVNHNLKKKKGKRKKRKKGKVGIRKPLHKNKVKRLGKQMKLDKKLRGNYLEKVESDSIERMRKCGEIYKLHLFKEKKAAAEKKQRELDTKYESRFKKKKKEGDDVDKDLEEFKRGKRKNNDK